MNLEHLIGVKNESYVDELELRRSLRHILAKRSTSQDFEKHFSMFNALSLLNDYEVSSEALDFVDTQLSSYIRTCRSSSEADIMLCDLILDHWPFARAVRLANVLALECRNRGRREHFVRELAWHGPRLHPGLADRMRELSFRLSLDNRPSRQSLGRQILHSLRRG